MKKFTFESYKMLNTFVVWLLCVCMYQALRNYVRERSDIRWCPRGEGGGQGVRVILTFPYYIYTIYIRCQKKTHLQVHVHSCIFFFLFLEYQGDFPQIIVISFEISVLTVSVSLFTDDAVYVLVSQAEIQLPSNKDLCFFQIVIVLSSTWVQN